MEKKEFVEKLSELVLLSSNSNGITKIEFNEELEFLHVHVESGYWMVSVRFDSTEAIIKDFAKFLINPSLYKFVDGRKAVQ